MIEKKVDAQLIQHSNEMECIYQTFEHTKVYLKVHIVNNFGLFRTHNVPIPLDSSGLFEIIYNSFNEEKDLSVLVELFPPVILEHF